MSWRKKTKNNRGEVLNREAPPRGPTLTLLYTSSDRKGTPFGRSLAVWAILGSTLPPEKKRTEVIVLSFANLSPDLTIQ